MGRISVLAILMSAALGGCGGSDEDQIRDAYVDFAEAFADADGEKVCDMLTRAGKRDVVAAGVVVGGGGDCPRTVKSLARLFDNGDLTALREAKVTKVTIDKDRAVVQGTANLDENAKPTQLRKVEGEWLIDADAKDAS